MSVSGSVRCKRADRQSGVSLRGLTIRIADPQVQPEDVLGVPFRTVQVVTLLCVDLRTVYMDVRDASRAKRCILPVDSPKTEVIGVVSAVCDGG